MVCKIAAFMGRGTVPGMAAMVGSMGSMAPLLSPRRGAGGRA